jgi:hypothetical protein
VGDDVLTVGATVGACVGRTDGLAEGKLLGRTVGPAVVGLEVEAVGFGVGTCRRGRGIR